MSGFERLNRLSLPRRTSRCADDVMIAPRLVLQLERVPCLPGRLTKIGPNRLGEFG
jgi:hypothetical protein